MAIALLEIPVSGWTCLRTEGNVRQIEVEVRNRHTLVDVRRVSLLAGPLALLLVAIGSTSRGCGFLAGRSLLCHLGVS